MGLFEDIKTAKAIESAELTTLKQRFATLEKAYQSALDMIENLRAEQIAMEDSRRDELNSAIKENHALKNAFAVVMDELKHEQKAKAAIVKNRNFWRREFEAVNMLHYLAEEELSELKAKQQEQSKLIPLRMSFTDNSEEMRLAANIVPAIGK